MNPGEQRVLAFIADRLESMLRRPAAWGSLQSVEDQLLQLLEMRRVVLVPSTAARDTQRLMRSYRAFVAEVLPHGTAEPLSVQLSRVGRAHELTSLLRAFVDRELALFVAEQSTPAGDEATFDARVEATARMIEYLRMESEAKARLRPAAAETVSFSRQELT